MSASLGLPGQPFLLGVNYWPRRKAMFWWSDFDAAEVRDEFALVRDLGMDLVRIFLLWDDWQPTPSTVSLAALRHLETVCDIAGDLGLGLDITFFTGHMSGPNWAPKWLLNRQQAPPAGARQVVSGGKPVNCTYANPFIDGAALGAEELLLQTVVNAFKEHPAVAMWNLGNEPDLFAWPPDPSSGRGWVWRLSGLIKGLDPVHPVTCGLHAACLIEDNGLHVQDVFAEVDVAVMHGYPMYAEGWADWTS